MGKPLDSATDLRSALVAWMIVSAGAALVALVVSAIIPISWLSLILSSLGSASVSVFVALLITEYVIKPLYVRDILQVAQLSSEVHNAGLITIRRLNGVVLSDILSGKDIEVAGHSRVVDRIWPHVVEVARAGGSAVRLYLPTDTAPSTWREYEQSWKLGGCEDKGASLELTLCAEGNQLLTVVTGSRCLVAVGDGMGPTGNPLIMVFSRARSEPYIDSIVRQMDVFRDSDVPPNYATGKKVRDG